jgi:tetratricopeptide (TPR) repeat protein
LLLRLRRYPEAREQFHAVLLANSDDTAAVVGIAHCQRAAGEIDAARNTLERVLGREPPVAAALSLRGMLALDRNDPHQAVLYLRRADSLDPYNGPTLKNLAAASRMLNEEADARKYEQRAEQVEKQNKRLEGLAKEALEKPAEVEPRIEAGKICMEMGRTMEALSWLAGALVLDPGDEVTRTALCECLDKIGAAGARESFQWLVASRPPAGTPTSP